MYDPVNSTYFAFHSQILYYVWCLHLFFSFKRKANQLISRISTWIKIVLKNDHSKRCDCIDTKAGRKKTHLSCRCLVCRHGNNISCLTICKVAHATCKVEITSDIFLLIRFSIVNKWNNDFRFSLFSYMRLSFDVVAVSSNEMNDVHLFWFFCLSSNFLDGIWNKKKMCN